MNSILLAMASNFNGISIFRPLYWVFGKCMELLLTAVNNQYFIALIIFTVATRVILLPINIHQQKTMAKTTRLQPKIQKIQKKYPDPKDRDKLNQEMQELYAREGHNPMQMGCGPMLFQMVFLMGIIGAVYYPLSYVIGISDFVDNSQAIHDLILPIYKELTGSDKIMYLHLEIVQHFQEYKDVLIAEFPKMFTADKVAAIEAYHDSMGLFGIDMAAFPHWKDGIIVIIPILCLVTSLGTSLYSTYTQKKNNPAAQQQMGSMMMMMLMMPFFSFYISFKVPAAVGFYWIISNLIALLQQWFIFKKFPPKRTQARVMIESTIERRSREESIKRTKTK